VLSAGLLLVLAAAAPQHGAHAHGRHGNPPDLEAYMDRLEDPARDAWQKPDAVLAALRLQPGHVACDVGAGPGYFTLRLARAVGARGFVFALDVEPAILDRLRARLAAAGVHNVAPVLSAPGRPSLPDGACDVALVVDTYHHFPDRPAYLRALARALKPGGRVVNVDFHKRETPVGPPLEHRLAREAFVEEARAAGYAVAAEETFLPYQYFLVLEPRP
jgi:ubiquinone/menaquinone biosynthesis C-methylase UbiE